MTLKIFRKNKTSWNSIWKKRRKFMSTSLILKDNEYGEFVVSNKARSTILNDSDFSLDAFLAEFAKQRIESISQIPDKCLIEIVKRLPIKDVLSLRLVNHRLNDLVQRNYELFSKLHLDGLSLMGTNSNKIVRFHPIAYRRNEASSSGSLYSQELEVPHIDRPLRHLRCNAVTLEHINLNNGTLHSLKRSLKYKFKQLDMLYCGLGIDRPAEFAYIIQQWGVQELSFSHCTWPENQELVPICDKLFEFNQQLQHVSIAFDKLTNIAISNASLRKWASHTTWPRSFILHNVKSEITHEGIAAIVFSYVAQARAKREKIYGSTILWNFGVVNTSLDWLTRELAPIEPNIRYLKEIAQGVHMKIQVSPDVPALHVRLSFSFRSLKVAKKSATNLNSLPSVLSTL